MGGEKNHCSILQLLPPRLVLSYLQVLFALFALFRRRVRHRRPASDAAEDNVGRTGAKDVHAGPVRPGGFHTLFVLFPCPILFLC